MLIIQVWTTDKDYNAILENNVDSLSKEDLHKQVKKHPVHSCINEGSLWEQSQQDGHRYNDQKI